MQLDIPLSARISIWRIALAIVLPSLLISARAGGQEAETFFENRSRPLRA